MLMGDGRTMQKDLVTFRDARRSDLERIVELLGDYELGSSREIVSDPVDSAYERAFEEMLAQPGNCVVVAVKGTAVVGCLQLTIVPGLSRRGAKRAFIEGVRVSSEHRSSGIGQLLFERFALRHLATQTRYSPPSSARPTRAGAGSPGTRISTSSKRTSRPASCSTRAYSARA
jgi:ribosomal protein S18 acetylase RimI-like enzyme